MKPVTLYADEISQFSPMPFDKMTQAEKKAVATRILRTRGGDANNYRAVLLEMNIPGAQRYRLANRF